MSSANVWLQYLLAIAAGGATLVATRGTAPDWGWGLAAATGAMLAWARIGSLPDVPQRAACLVAGTAWALLLGHHAGGVQWPLLGAAVVATFVRCLPALGGQRLDDAVAEATACQALRVAEHAVGPRPTTNGVASESFRKAVDTVHAQLNEAAALQLAHSALGYRSIKRLLQALLRRTPHAAPGATR